MLWLHWTAQLSALVTQSVGTFEGGRPHGKIIGQHRLDSKAVPIHFVLLSTLNPPWARDQFRYAVQGQSLKDVKMPDLRLMAEWKPGGADLQNAEHRRAWKSAVEQELGTWTIVVEDARGFAKVFSKDGADFLKAGLSKNENQPGSSGSWVDLNRDCKAPGKPLGYAVSPRSAAMLLVLGRSPEAVRHVRSELVTQGRLSEACVSIASSAAPPPEEEDDSSHDGSATMMQSGVERSASGNSQFLPVVDDRSSAWRQNSESLDVQLRRPVEIWDVLSMLLQLTGGGYFLLLILLILLTCGICTVVYGSPIETIRTNVWQAKDSTKTQDARTTADSNLPLSPEMSRSDVGRKASPIHPFRKAWKGCSAMDANE